MPICSYLSRMRWLEVNDYGHRLREADSTQLAKALTARSKSRLLISASRCKRMPSVRPFAVLYL